MPSAQEFLAAATQKAATDLITALNNLPADKRTWSPFEKGRSAMDQVAEVAMLNGETAKLLETRTMARDYDFTEFLRRKEALAQDEAAAKALLAENTAKLIAAIRAQPDDALEVSVDMPWGPMTIGQIMAYPQWNASYHEGQINYIASLV